MSTMSWKKIPSTTPPVVDGAPRGEATEKHGQTTDAGDTWCHRPKEFSAGKWLPQALHNRYNICIYLIGCQLSNKTYVYKQKQTSENQKLAQTCPDHDHKHYELSLRELPWLQ